MNVDARPTEPNILRQNRVDSETQQRLDLDLHIPEDLSYFEGHFPDAPVLPGVALTDWAVRFASDAFGMPPQISGISRLKFYQVVQPGRQLTLSFTHYLESRSTDFIYTSAEATHASGRIAWR